MKIPKKSSKKIYKENSIISFCNNKEKHINEIIEHLDKINIHTLRSKYLYPMVREERLIKLPGRKYIANNKKKDVRSGFREVTAKEWKEMGLPSESYTISPVKKKEERPYFYDEPLIDLNKSIKEISKDVGALLKNRNQHLDTISKKINSTDNKLPEYRIDPITGKQILKEEFDKKYKK